VDGTAELDVHVGGTPDQPELDGRINLTDAEFALPNPRAIIGDLSGPILLKGNTILIPPMRGSANGGDLDIEGELELIGRELAGEINAQATGVAIEFPRGLRSEADFILTFRPGPGTPRLIGDVRIQRASFTETLSLAALARTRSVTPPRLTGAAGPSFVDRISLNVSLVTVEDMVVDNNYGRFDTGASVRLVGTAANPGMTGRITLREGGEVYLAGRTFKINRGDISFTELTRIAPEFNLEAEARVGRDDLTMQLTGPVEKPEFTLTSSSRDKTGEELAASLIGGNNTGQSALTLLSADLLGVTGRALRLDTLRIEQGDAFESDFREDPTLIYNDADPATRLTISKRLREDVEITVSQNLKENGKTTFIVSYYIVPDFEIRAISKDDSELGIGVRHQLTFGGPAGVAAAARPPQPVVAAITFAGDPAPLQEAAIRRELRLSEGEEFNFYDWQRDIDEIRAAYFEQGRYEARVRARRVTSNDGGPLTLEYRLEPGPRTAIEVRGVELPAAELRAMEEAWTRAVFDRFLMDDLENRVRRYLVTSGHVEGTVEGRLSEEAGLKHATLIVDPGAHAGSRAIVFNGNTAIAANRLADAVTGSGLDVDAWLDPQQLVPALKAFYQDHGFLDVEVAVGVPHIESGRGVLPVTLVEGRGVAVTEIALTGVAEVRRDFMRAELGLQTPAAYETARVLEARNRLERAYRTRGFNTVQIETDSKVDATKSSIALTFAVTEGPQQVLRDVVTSGATRTREGIVSRALNLPVDAPVNLEEWARARKRLYDTNVFRQVDVTAEPMGEAVEGIQPVRARVTVVEYPPWRFRYGLQLEGDRQAFEEGTVGADELGVVAEVKNQNLMGRAVTGGVFARYERLAHDATVFASNASFFGLPIRSSVFGFFTRDKFRGDPTDPDRVIAITDRIGASFEQRVRPRGLQVTYAYRLETNHTYDPEPSPSDEFPLNVRANLGRLSSAVIYDRRNDLLDARTGTFSAASVEHAAGWLGSDAHYTKTLAQQQVFFSPSDPLVLASRAQFGLTWHPENLLPIDRFRAGGATTVRGYPEDSLGPSDFFGLPKGGGQLVILNQEIRFPLYRWFGGVGFIDAGNIFDAEYQFDWSELKFGYGVGLRLSSPVGMLRLDVGIPGSSIQSLPTIKPNSFGAARWYFGLGHVF
jgi:outer membrane protein assembly factor BamA